MITFIIGLIVLFCGARIYGSFCEKVLSPSSDIKTPAIKLRDNIDYVPMSKWRNSLIELLNIAGTGPVLGSIQGILFGPITFITIPIGCIISGAVHDYMSGMISIRNDGKQMPLLIRKFLGNKIYTIYSVFVCLLLILVGTVFIYTPSDLIVSQVLDGDIKSLNTTLLLVYGIIFVYYLIATMFPIDKIIGYVYPVFGAVLLISAIGIFFGIFAEDYPLTEIWQSDNIFDNHPFGEHFIPIFFITIACGITSGFHSTQATIISRTVSNEKDGRFVFYDMMIVEGFIAMCWSGAAMGVVNLGLATSEELYKTATVVVGTIAKDIFGDAGGIIAVVGVIILAITSGDTALRSLRLMMCDALNISSRNKLQVLLLAASIFTVVAAVLCFSKINSEGFSLLWRYFSWANETIAVFAFTLASIYMIKNKMPYWITLLPGSFYMYIVSAYIIHAPIGFNLNYEISYILAALCTLSYAIGIIRFGRKLE